MCAVKVVSHSLHSLDLNAKQPAKRTIREDNESIYRYAKEVSEGLISNPRSRSYSFIDSQELVVSCVSRMLEKEKWDEATTSVANKLYQVESDAQDRVSHITDIKTGGLLQIKLEHEDEVKIILVKIDINDFLTEEDVEIRSGLPFGKERIQKAAMMTINSDGEVHDLLVSDSRPKITEYWYKFFLVARELNSNESNTKKAFSSIENVLDKKVKNVSKKDYWHLRNDIVSYFKNEDDFLFGDILKLIERYKPESGELKDKMSEVIEKVKKLPENEKNGFDKQFEIEANCIKARMKKVISLGESVELSIKGEVSDFVNKITPHLDSHGKGIVIYSDSGYREFGGTEG